MGGKSAAKEANREAARIRADEAARQERIREGTTAIGQIFEGGNKTGTGQLAAGAAYDPNAEYYTATGERWAPTAATSGAGKGVQFTQDPNDPNRYSVPKGTSVFDVMFHKGPFASGGATGDAQSQFAEALKNGLFSGVETGTGAFGGDFYEDRAKAFVDYATPQLESQRSDAAKDLIFALTRSGNLDSSSRATKEGELQKLYDTQYQGILDQGQAYANTARTNVEDARSDLIKTLNATGDAEAASSGAINRAAALSAPDTYSPLSQLFADFTATLGTQLAMEKAEAASGRDYAKYSTGLFNPGRTTVTGN
jgi:hypothetical protein